MQEQFNDLRDCIYQTEDKFLQFRQLVVNCVMSTDIMDQELGAAWKEHWNVAFANLYFSREEEAKTIVNHKSTIVIEHLIQAIEYMCKQSS